MPLLPYETSPLTPTNSSKKWMQRAAESPQMECDKIAERWSLLNQSGNINDEELMSLFDISEKKINERRSSMQALRGRSLQVMAWWFKQFTPLQPYDKRVQKAALMIREGSTILCPNTRVFASACNPSNV